MTTTNKEVALTTTSSVPEILKAIDSKIAEIKLIQDSVYKTNKIIKLAGGTQVNLETEDKIDNLVKAYASISAREEQYTKAQAELGITTAPVCKIDGYTKEDWKSDILLRKSIIEQKDTLDQLSEMRKQWTDLMDKEDRKAILLEKMMAFAGTIAE